MTTLLKTIESARNDAIKAMSSAEVEAAALSILNNCALPAHASQVTKQFVSKMNAECSTFNQLMVEYHLRRFEISMAADAAADYFDAIA